MHDTSSSPPWVLPAAEILVVGFPFSVFKLVSGLVASRGHGAPGLALGAALVVLGGLDLALNAANLVGLVLRGRRILDVCVLDALVRRLDRRAARGGDLGVALDVFLSFGLVAFAVAFGTFAAMPRWALPIWNACVVLNVLGAGVGRLFGALRERRSRDG